jgi:hypothetical protein
MRALAVLAAACACGHPAPPERAPPAPERGPTTVTQPGFPNVHARLRLTQQQPATPQRDTEVEIWLKGSRFRVRDLAGRRFEEMDADLTAPRGLGAPARSMEDFMDRGAAARRAAKGPTELFGDLAAGDGWVYRATVERRSQPAAELVAVAEQILAQGKDAGLTKAGDVTLLGRAATEYRGTATVTEDATQYQNVVHRVIAPPYLLLEELHDVIVPGLAYRREVLSLDEGGVSDADVTPPAP